ncbi:hydantoinase/oxoprolinase N-terminal domain-containing protein [Candidatus Poriferisodalis sp.]|uniref:hydantoinase/oxoprolinase N-terminal domain-containing protein n=1 Tax=Candidatus Poriferisodalis sp. TaxID=3101277 RepID=UPI003B0233A7
MTTPRRTPSSPWCLGIDTGGTFTDAVVYCSDTRRVLASAKIPTRHEDLRGCVVEAMRDVLTRCGESGDATGRRPGVDRSAMDIGAADLAANIGVVAVSTTLATNAVVEGTGRPAGLVAIGLAPEALARVGLYADMAAFMDGPILSPSEGAPAADASPRGSAGTGSRLAAAPVVLIDGGHNAHGEELAPLDLDELVGWLSRIDGSVEAYGVAAQFSVRNPAHERQARDAIRERCGKPVTCSHELTPKLDGPRRAVTTLLNAQLIPVTARFAEAIRAAMDALELDAPLMVVRADGTLAAAEFAIRRPIEIVHSGPAASVIGARHLAASAPASREALDEAGLVVDIGGTTTDIAAIRGGAVVSTRSRDSAETATVGGHATMVAAMPTVTVGLGGDSEIWIPPHGRRGELAVGPRRVMPLCVAAVRHPRVVMPMLMRQLGVDRPLAECGQVLLRAGAAVPDTVHADRTGRGDIDAEVLRLLDEAGGALALDELQRSARGRSALERLERGGLVRRAALTPTDACVVLGLIDAAATRDGDAATAGAELFSRRCDRYGVRIGSGAGDLCRRIVQQLVRSVTEALLAVALGADGVARSEIDQQFVQAALDRRRRAWGRTAAGGVDGADASLRDEPLWGLLGADDPRSAAIADQGTRRSAGRLVSQEVPRLAEPPRLSRIDIGAQVPVIAIGAPASTYAPLAAALLGTEAVVPAHAEVANAVGAAVAQVRITKRITVTAPRRGSYRAHLGDDPPLWHSLNAARAWATAQATDAALSDAVAAGATDPVVTVDWATRTAPSNGRELFVEATLRVTAAGPPASRAHSVERTSG